MADKATAKAIDFSGVKDRGDYNPKQVTEGDYRATIVQVKDGEGKKSGDFQYEFKIKLEKYSQYSYPYYCTLTEQTLWKLRNLLIAAGINVPKKKVKLDPNRVIGKAIGVTMEDDEYDGKMKSVIGAVFPVSELAEGTYDASEDDASEPEEPTEAAAASNGTKKKKGKKGKKGKKSESEELDLDDL